MTAGPNAALFTSSSSPGRNPLLLPSQLFEAELAGGVGATVDIPGPAAGFVRLFDQVQVVSNTFAAPMAGVAGDIIVPGPTAFRVGSGLTGVSSQNLLAMGIGAGELFRVTNGGANAGKVRATYQDVPVAGIPGLMGSLGLVRMHATAAPAVAIPAPAGATVYRRWLQSPAMSSATRAVIARANLQNNDTGTTHELEFFFAALLSRSTAGTGPAVIGLPPPANFSVTAATGDLTASTVAAIVGGPFALTGIWEELPL